jgi:uncharacterized protein YkwD
MVRLGAHLRAIVVPLALSALTLLSVPRLSTSSPVPVFASTLAGVCAPLGTAPTANVQSGRPYLGIAFDALARDRARFAGLGPQRRSAILTMIAERHSAYMASIGTWSDGDPDGGILTRVRAAGLNATYAGQNVVTASSASVPAAIAQGEAFFAQEAAGGGPHWDNITNPNHAYVGVGIAVLGSAGGYTIYLTQVFSDAGGCGAASAPAPDTFTPAADTTTTLRIGDIVHPSVDALLLRTEPHGKVIGTLHARDQLKVVDMQQGWAQVQVLSSGTFGWAFAGFLVSE